MNYSHILFLNNYNLAGSELETHLGLMRRGLLYNETFSHSVYTSKLWFDNMTTYINILQDFHEQLGTKITKVNLIHINISFELSADIYCSVFPGISEQFYFSKRVGSRQEI